MPDHPVKRKLERDVLPYLVSARRLQGQWFCRLYGLFGLTTDLIVAFAAIGVTTPFLALLGAQVGTDKNTPSLATALASVPTMLYFPAAGLIILWISLRVYFNREDGQKRAVLARNCTQVLRQAEAKLPTALEKSNPMPELTELLEKSIRPTVDQGIQQNSWPWTPFAPGIEQEVDKELQLLCKRYERDWTPVEDPTAPRNPIAGATI